MRYLIFALVVAIACCACEPEAEVRESTRISESRSLRDPIEQSRLAEALDVQGIPYTIEDIDGREFLRWSGSDSARVEALLVELFGPEPPVGRSIHFEGVMQDRFKSWLTENELDYTTIVNRDREYVVWDAAIDSKVRSWEFFPSLTE